MCCSGMQVLPGNRSPACRAQQDQSPAPFISALPFAVACRDPRSRQPYHHLSWLKYHLLLLLLAWDHQPRMFATNINRVGPTVLPDFLPTVAYKAAVCGQPCSLAPLCCRGVPT